MNWQTIFEYAPGLVANIAIVWLLVDYLKKRDDQFAASLEQVEARHHKACEDTGKVIDKASEAMRENTRVLGQVDATLRRAQNKLERS